MNLDVAKAIEATETKHAASYMEAIERLLVATIRRDRVLIGDAKTRLREVFRDTLGVAETLGARLALREAARVLQSPSARFQDEPKQSILPRVTLDEAIQDMIDRTPVVIRDAAERTAENIAKLYSEGVNVAFVRSTEIAVTTRAQQFIEEAIRKGTTEFDLGSIGESIIKGEVRPWTEAYSRMAFRTNLNTATTAGRFRQAMDPDVADVIPAFRFHAVIDSTTRENHMAADGFIAKTTNPIWRRIAPPLGYSCRCSVQFVSFLTLRRMGRIDDSGSVMESRLPSGAGPDPKFRHGDRPDLFMTRGGT